MHALEEIHRLLKPTGALIDIHPVADYSSVEVHGNGKVDIAGKLFVRQWWVDFQAADNAITEIVQRGRFVVEQEVVFDSLTHYASATEMEISEKEAIDRFARDGESARESYPQVEVLAARAGKLMQAARGKVELIIREPTLICRLRPT